MELYLVYSDSIAVKKFIRRTGIDDGSGFFLFVSDYTSSTSRANFRLTLLYSCFLLKTISHNEG